VGLHLSGSALHCAWRSFIFAFISSQRCGFCLQCSSNLAFPFFTAFFGIGFALRLPLLHLRFHFFAALRILFAVLVKARFSFRATFFGISGALRLPLFHPGFHLLAPLRIGLAAFGHGSFARIRVTCLRDYRRTGIGMNGGARQSLRTRK
jgi:hypothetical protein